MKFLVNIGNDTKSQFLVRKSNLGCRVELLLIIIDGELIPYLGQRIKRRLASDFNDSFFYINLNQFIVTIVYQNFTLTAFREKSSTTKSFITTVK